MKANTIEVTPFGKETEVIDVSKLADDFSGHAGGDNRLVKAFLDYITGEPGDMADTITSVERSMESHYMALAAEESRLNGGKVISLAQMREEK